MLNVSIAPRLVSLYIILIERVAQMCLKEECVLLSAARPVVTSLQDAGREPPSRLDKHTAAHALTSTFLCGRFCLFTHYFLILRLLPLMFITFLWLSLITQRSQSQPKVSFTFQMDSAVAYIHLISPSCRQ